MLSFDMMDGDLEKNDAHISASLAPQMANTPSAKGSSTNCNCNFSWKNVSYSVGGKQILNSISGNVEKGATNSSCD
jgi:hypothetical protein